MPTITFNNNKTTEEPDLFLGSTYSGSLDCKLIPVCMDRVVLRFETAERKRFPG